MIITNVCLLLEALSIVICLHHLYGEKFRLDIATVSFLSVDMIIMAAINYFGLPKTYTMVIYPVIVLYCGFRFRFQVKELVVNIILCIILVGVTQMMVTFSVCYVLKLHSVTNIDLMVIGGIEFLLILFALPKNKVKYLSRFLQNNERILLISIIMSVVIALLWLFFYKRIELMEAYQAILLFCSIGFLLVLSGQLIKYKVKVKEAETELKMHKLYSESFQGLIDDIRLRQHEFDNHINAIYSQHFSYHTYEELVEAQKEYCELITNENRFNKLLSQDNPVIRSFLYGRFIEIDKMGIELSYQVAIKDFNVELPVYKLVEILGDLMNNAVDALLSDVSRKKMHITIMETDGFFLEVRNESSYITYDMLGQFFVKGYSKKGKNRGLGLYNVKQICDEYSLEVAPECIEINGINWLSFKIWKVN